MKPVTLIDRRKATKLSLELKDVAYAIAKTLDTLPGYCNSPECQLFMQYATLASQLKEGQVCICIDGKPIFQYTDQNMKLMGTERTHVAGMLCCTGLENGYTDGDILHLHYIDGIKERYRYVPRMDAWVFMMSNIPMKAESPSLN